MLLPRNNRVLDIGCGEGYPIGEYLCQCVFSAVGIDISDKMIEIAREQNLPNSIFIEKDFLDSLYNAYG